MMNWAFYGRHDTLSTLDSLIHKQRWFFCRIQGRRRIGKTTLLKELMKSDPSLAGRMIYMQVPNSDERDVAASFRRALKDSGSDAALLLADTIDDFASMARAIGLLCRQGMMLILDEFQYFTSSKLQAFNSHLQAQVDQLKDTDQGGLFVLGSLQSEMNALLNDAAAPLYGRLTASIDLQHWDFEDLTTLYSAHGIDSPTQWLTLWSFFEGVPKFYRDAYEQELFSVPAENFGAELLTRLFLKEGSPLAEEAHTSFLREVRGKMMAILNYLSEHPGCVHGELIAALNKDDDTSPMGTYIARLVESYRIVDKRWPVFSDSKSRNARYYITDNFLQGWLSVVKPARDAARLRPLAQVLQLAKPRTCIHEGGAFEKWIRQLHIECSRKGKGDFALTDINLGFWNHPRDVDKTIEIDLVAINSDDKRVRFGSCKRNARAHDNLSLAKFEAHIQAFLASKEGKRLEGWKTEKVLFSPVFLSEEKKILQPRGYACLDLPAYASLF